MRHSHRSWRMVATALVAFALGRHSIAGELDEARESVRKPKRESSRAESTPRDPVVAPSFDSCEEGWLGGFCRGGDDGPFDSWTGRSIWFVTSAPFRLPYLLLRDDDRDGGYVVAAPYEDAPAALLTESEPRAEMPLVFGRLQFDALTNFDDLARGGGALLIESPKRFGIDAAFAYWHERLDRGADQLWLGDVNLVYRFAQSPGVQFRAGLGLNWLADEKRADLGVNFTYGVDVFPAKPWVVTETLDFGTLGEAGLFRSQTTVGVVRGEWEFFTGFEYTRLGGGTLLGWMNGVRWRF